MGGGLLTTYTPPVSASTIRTLVTSDVSAGMTHFPQPHPQVPGPTLEERKRLLDQGYKVVQTHQALNSQVGYAHSWANPYIPPEPGRISNSKILRTN